MARVAKQAEVRQDELLDIAQRMFLVRGYDDTSIQAIIDEAGIAKGTFYHHYPSKPALLDALVARMTGEALATIRPLLEDRSLGPVERLSRVFLSISAWKLARRDVMIQMHRALHAPANAHLLARITRESMAAFAPFFAQVLEEGVAAGVFNTRYSRETARIILDLGATLGRSLGDALLIDGPPAPTREEVRLAMDAYHDAVARLLGTAPGVVKLVDVDQVLLWFQDGSTP